MTDPIQPVGPREIPPVKPVERRQWRVDGDQRRERDQRRQPRREPPRRPPGDEEHLIDIEA
jgi:hypothetical protein